MWRTPSAGIESGSFQPAGQKDMSKTTTIVRMRRDGVLHRVMPDGSEAAMAALEPTSAMTAAEIHAAALRDPDAQPLTEEDMAGMRRVPRVKTVRRALGLTQEEFATRFKSRSERCGTGNKAARNPTSPPAPTSR